GSSPSRATSARPNRYRHPPLIPGPDQGSREGGDEHYAPGKMRVEKAPTNFFITDARRVISPPHGSAVRPRRQHAFRHGRGGASGVDYAAQLGLAQHRVIHLQAVQIGNDEPATVDVAVSAVAAFCRSDDDVLG